MPKTTMLLALALLSVAVSPFLMAPADPASAHANQVRSSPSPNQVLETSPGRVIVWFSEPIEGSFSRIQVLDADGNKVDNGDSAPDPTEPTAMTVTLPQDLTNGTYTVAWRNLSTIDGHTVVGSYLFAIGEPVGAGAAVDTSQPLLQTPVDPLLRWAFFIGAMVLFGGLLFELVVVGPAFSDAARGTRRHAAAVSLGSVTTWVSAVAIGLVVTGHGGALVQQAHVASEFGISLDGIRAVAFESSWGRFWLWRVGAVLAATIALVLAARSRSGNGAAGDQEGHLLITESVFGQTALVASAGVLILTTLASHSAATPPDIRTLATLTDLVHIVAAGAWTGGLAALVIGLPMLRRAAGDEIRPILAESVPRFSTLAMLSAGALIITGIFSRHHAGYGPGGCADALRLDTRCQATADRPVAWACRLQRSPSCDAVGE
jgi:copper transport protein